MNNDTNIKTKLLLKQNIFLIEYDNNIIAFPANRIKGLKDLVDRALEYAESRGIVMTDIIS